MGYSSDLTRAGYALQAKLFAEGGDMPITRVEVGSGVCPEGTDPGTLSALVQPRCTATSTKPRRQGCSVDLIIEYRSDLAPELDEPFQINEFGVFAIGAEGTEELILYGDLSSYPETAVPQRYGGCVRRYPVHIEVGPSANVQLTYPAGAWATVEEVDQVVQEALKKSLSLEDGTSVPQTVERISAKVDSLVQAAESDGWRHVFEPEDWAGGELRIPRSLHGMGPTAPVCICTIRQRLGRTAYEFDETTAAPAFAAILDAVREALETNAQTPETYPAAADGHIQLTWEQVQYLLLEGQLISAAAAEAKASELGFAWRDRDNGVEPSVTLDELLAAAYLPALGAPSTAYDALCTLQTIQGLRLRRGVDGQGHAARYDLDGYFTTTWGTMATRAEWDLITKDLVLYSSAPFAGDLLVTGRPDTSEETAETEVEDEAEAQRDEQGTGAGA